jgi:hypothetical protein
MPSLGPNPPRRIRRLRPIQPPQPTLLHHRIHPEADRRPDIQAQQPPGTVAQQPLGIQAQQPPGIQAQQLLGTALPQPLLDTRPPQQEDMGQPRPQRADMVAPQLPGDMPVAREQLALADTAAAQPLAAGTWAVAETLLMERRPATRRSRGPFHAEPRNTQRAAETPFAPAPTAG